MNAWRRLWRGEIPLGEAFWLWGILAGAVINLFATLLAVLLLTAEVPAWIGALVFAAPIPFNVCLLVGVWRSAGHAEVGENRRFLARAAMTIWALVLSLS